MKSLIRFSNNAFVRNCSGAVSLPFALSIIPIMASIGAAVDLGRGIVMASNVQSAVDQATLAAANASGNDTAKKAYADQILLASLHGTSATTTFVTNSDGSVTYTARATMNTMFVPYIAPTVSIGRSATAKATVAGTEGTAGSVGWADTSCILTLGEDLDLDSDNIMTWNGSPSVSLTGCTLRSNRSMKCNGNNIGASASYAHGSITGSCPNPLGGQAKVEDIYKDYQTNITPLCGAEKGGYSWAPTNGTLPAAGTVVKVPATANANYNQIHICGTLTLSGTRQLVANVAGGTEPAKDTIIVIENGGLTLANDASITAKRITFVLSGKNAAATNTAKPIVTWPTGNGNAAHLISTPGVHADNPFRGMSIYVDPDNNDDQSWKPGANARFDGVVYMPKAKLTLSGNMQFGAKECLKIVTAQFTLNGNVALSMRQSSAACSAINMRYYEVAPVAAVAGTAAVSSYLIR
jgi:Flp pilus assembly protein TadG